MGTDQSGARVRFYREDYKVMREIGDRYIEEHERYYRELDQELERKVSEARRREPTHRERIEQISSGIQSVFQKFFSPKTHQDPHWLRRRRENRYQRQRRWLHERLEREELEHKTMDQPLAKCRQREPKPSTLVWYRSSERTPWSRVELSAKSPLYALNELKEVCEKGAYTLSRNDRMLLDAWIEKQRQQILELNRKARSVGFIELRVGAEDVRTYGPDSTFEELRALWNANRTGRVVLRDEETRALAWWLSKKQRGHDRGNRHAEEEKRKSR